MWTAPNAEQIEAAADSLKAAKPDMLQAEKRELIATRLSGDFQFGYLLGLQTARIVLAGSVALALKAVNPEELL